MVMGAARVLPCRCPPLPTPGPPMRRFILALATLILAAPVSTRAQETPTERDAAHVVVQKQMDLERSLNINALVSRLTGPNAARDAVAARAKQLMDTELLAF